MRWNGRRGLDNRMEPELHISPSIAALDPLIISSPTTRSGTTLLQRLLCSSSRAIIYGELCAQDLEFFLNLYAFKIQEYTYHRRNIERGMDQVLSGEVESWIPDLMPDIDGYLNAIGQSAFAGLVYCRDYAEKMGRPVWGLKHPSWKPAILRLIHNILPGARFIYLYRDVVDCLKSAKAQLVIQSLQDVQEFCQAWVEGVQYVMDNQGDPRILPLRYEDLIAQPGNSIEEIARFSSVSDIKPVVLNRRVNAWTGENYLAQARDGYTPPAELTEIEMRIVDEMTSHVRVRLYPDGRPGVRIYGAAVPVNG